VPIESGMKIATFELEFGSRSNCAVMRRAQPGQEVRVLVRPTDDPRAAAVLGTGRRSVDGTLFDVQVVSGAAVYRLDWNYKDLLRTIDRLYPAATLDAQSGPPGATDGLQPQLRCRPPQDFCGDAAVDGGPGE